MKLYDLTTLCEEAEEEKCQNPFTLPVAVLLYKWVSEKAVEKPLNLILWQRQIFFENVLSTKLGSGLFNILLIVCIFICLQY